MKLTILTAVTGLVVLAFVLELLRRRRLREKYAMLWLAVSLIVVPLGLFPRLLDNLATAVGVASGASLVLFLGFTFLLLVTMHLSWESSQLEDETRRLAEEIALIRTDMGERDRAVVTGPAPPASAEPVVARVDPVVAGVVESSDRESR